MAILVALGLVPARSESTTTGSSDWPRANAADPPIHEVEWQQPPVSAAVGAKGRVLWLHRVQVVRDDGEVTLTLGYRLYDASGHIIRESALAPSLEHARAGVTVTSYRRGFLVDRRRGVDFHVSPAGAVRVVTAQHTGGP